MDLKLFKLNIYDKVIINKNLLVDYYNKVNIIRYKYKAYFYILLTM